VVFVLDPPYLPASLRAALARGRNFYDYPQTTGFVINNEGEDSLPNGQFDLLMHGKGNLELYYANPRPFNFEETLKIFQSSRKAINVSGLQCVQNAGALIGAEKQAPDPKALLVLYSPTFIEAAFGEPRLLDSQNIGTLLEYQAKCKENPDQQQCFLQVMPAYFFYSAIQKIPGNDKIHLKMIYNLYLLRSVIAAKYGKGEKLARVEQLLDLSRKNFWRQKIDFAQIEEEAREEFKKHGLNTKPKKTFESCPKD
jgi:hypothetical protein